MQPKKRTITTQTLVVGALCIAMAFVLSYVRLWKMPQGGSVTLMSMLPIFLYAYLYGLGPGLLAGLVYSLLQFIQEPYFVTPLQFLLDYTIGFTALGLAGIFSKTKMKEIVKFPLGCAIAGLTRTLSSFLSGVIFYGEYAAPGQPVWLYSFLYNFPSLGTDTLIAVLGAVLITAIGLVSRLKTVSSRA
jgi:thiamine transporter